MSTSKYVEVFTVNQMKLQTVSLRFPGGISSTAGMVDTTAGTPCPASPHPDVLLGSRK